MSNAAIREGGDDRRPPVSSSGQAPANGQPAAHSPRSGEVCPKCGAGYLDYDGLLNLSCPACGYTAGAGGCFS